MKKQSVSAEQAPNVSLFQATAHSPSYASLTNNFETAKHLKDYCIPVNSYFPTPAIMNALYQKLLLMFTPCKKQLKHYEHKENRYFTDPTAFTQ